MGIINKEFGYQPDSMDKAQKEMDNIVVKTRLTKREVMDELFERGGSVDRQLYTSYSREVILTYIRFDIKHDAWDRYVVFEDDKFICVGPTRSEIERRLGICA